MKKNTLNTLNQGVRGLTLKEQCHYIMLLRYSSSFSYFIKHYYLKKLVSLFNFLWFVMLKWRNWYEMKNHQSNCHDQHPWTQSSTQHGLRISYAIGLKSYVFFYININSIFILLLLYKCLMALLFRYILVLFLFLLFLTFVV